MADSRPASWPVALRQYLDTCCGGSPVIEPLGGMGGGSVTRLRHAGVSRVLKRSRSAVETYVYTRLAGLFEEFGVVVPRLYWSGQEGADYWLVIEDIPRALPEDRRGADAEVVEMLRRLHQIPRERVRLPAGAYRPAWPTEMTAAALSLFPDGERGDLAGMLESVWAAALPLFEPECPVSGDPNPLNWGLRDDGGLVLFDWERFTLGTPAIDLAIIVPGLGDVEAYRRVAATYLAEGDAPDAVSALAEQVRLAKAWSVVEFMSQVAAGTVEPTFSMDALVEQVGAWLGNDAGR